MFNQMLSWPNTPSSQQLARASKVLQQTQESDSPVLDDDTDSATTIRDVLILSTCLASAEYRQWAFQTFRARSSGAHDPISLMGLFSYLAGSGETDMTIGVALRETTPKPSDMKAKCNFGQIPRHPEWMGFAPIWTKVQGLHALVAESHSKPNNPGSSSSFPKKKSQTTGFPTIPSPKEKPPFCRHS